MTNFHIEGVYVTGGEVHITGSAIGRNASVGALDAFRTELADLAADRRATDEIRDHLYWLAANATSAREPADAAARVSGLRSAGAWLWGRLTAVIDSSGPALATWLLTLVR